MPAEASPKASNRWEGTHTYKKPEAVKKRARTVAQLREEAAAKSKAGREEAINKRRGSIGGLSTTREQGATLKTRTEQPRSLTRRGSTGGIVRTEEATELTTEQEETEHEEENAPAGEEDEEMPGSSKKKRHASATPAGGAEGEGGVDKDLKAFLIAMKDDINQSTNAAVERIEKRIDGNAKQIRDLRQEVERKDATISARISAEVRQEVAKISGALKAKTGEELSTGAISRRERAFHHCRKTLKMWPIRGEDLEDEVKNFLANKLKFDQRKIELLGMIDVIQAPGRSAKDKGEVLATFETKEDRDSVKAGGINLAGDRESGMAIHVPGHLMDNLIALNGVGYNIKSKHSGVKRTVKFDDTKQDVYLDICINGNWKRITPTKAKSVMEKLPGPSGTTGGLSLSLDDVSNLVVGEPVAGLTAVAVPEEEDEQ